MARLYFSTTQQWDNTFSESERRRAAEIQRLNPAAVERLVQATGPPPSNSDSRTRADLAALRVLQSLRAAADVHAIREQMTRQGCVKLFTRDARLRKLALDTFDVVSPYTYLLKKHFDRVRPSYLDPRIRPCIEVPGHASYPSGHATEAFSIGLVLGRADPCHAQEYMRVAFEIARNREMAGVHYQSDTQAGNRLARALQTHVARELRVPLSKGCPSNAPS